MFVFSDLTPPAILPVDIIVGVIVGVTLLGLIIAVTVVIIYCGNEMIAEEDNSRPSSSSSVRRSVRKMASTTKGKLKKKVRTVQLLQSVMPDKNNDDKKGLMKMADSGDPRTISDITRVSPIIAGRNSVLTSADHDGDRQWPEATLAPTEVPSPFFYVSAADLERRHVFDRTVDTL